MGKFRLYKYVLFDSFSLKEKECSRSCQYMPNSKKERLNCRSFMLSIYFYASPFPGNTSFNFDIKLSTQLLKLSSVLNCATASS